MRQTFTELRSSYSTTILYDLAFMDEKKGNQISAALIKWYHQHKRELPWRETSDPYLIWISEIILQQTRVAQGLDYYNRFISRFPDVRSLANANEDEVLTYWQGLGYYSRARNLHFAAKSIVKNFGGIFPKNHKEILSLKGIGEYTAAAIASFSYNLPYAVLDGNVFRVLSRLFAICDPIDTVAGKKIFSSLAQEILDRNNPGIHNQAIMEFGALQCTPANPDCMHCPLENKCLGLARSLVQELPIKQGKTKIQNRYFNYLDIRYQDKIYIQKRTKNDIWKNLYELPLIETEENLAPEDLLSSKELKELLSNEKGIKTSSLPMEFKHALSHRIIYAKFYKIELAEPSTSLPEQFILIPIKKLSEYAVSRLVSKYIEKENGTLIFK